MPKKAGKPSLETPVAVAGREARRSQARFHRIVLAHDGNKCTKCGRRREELTGVYPDLRIMIADHITPKKFGGEDTVDNGQTHCFFCDRIYGWRTRFKKAERPRTEEEEARSRAAYYAEQEAR